jgi:integrase
MPLKLIAPRQGKSPNWTIRGTYIGVRVDQTTGTPDERFAKKILAKIRDEIERGAFAKPTGPTFVMAAIKYLENGGEKRFVSRLAEHFGNLPLARIDQTVLDAAAVTLYPKASPATRNRQVYAPVSAILKCYGILRCVQRPKGKQGNHGLRFFTPDEAYRLISAAKIHDSEFGLFLAFLLYTGCRLSEALAIDLSKVNLEEAWAYTPTTKNGKPRLIHLPPDLVHALAKHPRGLDRKGKLFRFGKNGRLYLWLDEAAKVAGVELPSRVAFHAFRHTWGAWMRRYAGLDTTGLVETGAWQSRQAASIYEHAVQSEEARRADLLPSVWPSSGGNVLAMKATWKSGVE